MPSDISGFTGTEIVNYVKSWVGNSSSDFQSFVEQTLPLAEMRFCKMLDWGFLNKQNLSLAVSSGTSEYVLDTTTIGYWMLASNVRQIFSSAKGIYLEKRDFEDLRRMDPDINDGNSSAAITAWAPMGDNRIIVYPPIFSDTVLKVDGKIRPAALSTLSNYPTIPYHYQESFIQYVLALALDRENDDRAQSQKAFSQSLIKQDVAEDVGSMGDIKEPRMKSLMEQRLDGVGASMDYLYNAWAWQSQD